MSPCMIIIACSKLSLKNILGFFFFFWMLNPLRWLLNLYSLTGWTGIFPLKFKVSRWRRKHCVHYRSDYLIYQSSLPTIKGRPLRLPLSPLRFLIFNSNEWRFLNTTKIILVSVIFAKCRDMGRKSVTNWSILNAFSLLTSFSIVLLIPKDGTLRNYRGFSPILPFNQFGETTLQIRNKSLSVLIDTGATLLVLNPTNIKQTLHQNNKTIPIIGFSNISQHVPISKTFFFFLRLSKRYTPFSL